MSRVTRSKKVDILQDDTELDTQISRSQTPAAEHRNILSEINLRMGLNTMEDPNVAQELKGLKAAYRATLGIAKRGRKKAVKRKDKQGLVVGTEEIVEDIQIPDKDSPVLETTPQLGPTKENTPMGRITRRQAAQEAQEAGQCGSPDIFIDKQVRSAMSQKLRDLDYAALFAGRYTGGRYADGSYIRTPRSNRSKVGADQNIYLAEEALLKASKEITATPELKTKGSNDLPEYDCDQTSVATSPSKTTISPVKTLAEVEEVYGSFDSPRPLEAADDSFLAQIISRSPAKIISRIEDSLEALDQLEEALEAVGEVALVEPEKARERSRTPKTRPDSLERSKVLRVVEPLPELKDLHKTTPLRTASAKPGFASMRIKSTTSKPSLKKATSMNFNTTQRDGRKSAEPPRMQTQSVVKTPKRPLSLMPPKDPVKSTKPLTKPSFELPGEALSLKKREAHEAKIKALEEEERKRREFKARPIRTSVVPALAPRNTVASLARQSRIRPDTTENDQLIVSKRNSAVVSNVGAYRPSIIQSVQHANVSAPRAKAPAPIRKPTPFTTHGPSMSGKAIQRSVSVLDVQAQRQRAKEIYERDSTMSRDMERERRDREAAAKRAREEAAERGRQASREWAEKQLAKRMASSDKLSAGYGPGGQLGLRG